MSWVYEIVCLSLIAAFFGFRRWLSYRDQLRDVRRMTVYAVARPFGCSHCGRRYADQRTFTFHVQAMHPDTFD